MSKAMAELACADWARETGRIAVRFRFGNVIGEGCRGFIPFLVQHAILHPDGDVPAEARGGGLIERDYVPVDHVVEVMIAAAAASCSKVADAHRLALFGQSSLLRLGGNAAKRS